MNKNFPLIALLLAAALTTSALAGCGTTAKDDAELTGSVGALYNDGLDQLGQHKYKKAVHTFDEIQRQYPYSGWSTRAEMMSAYASFKNNDADEATATADHFIKMHPGYPDLPYMYYLKGMALYNTMSDVNRDQSETAEALAAFSEIVNRFPDSIYAPDARQKILLCRDHLAGKEMEIGRYYEDRADYLAAINRFKTVVTTYQTTDQTPEALYRLTESYVALGIPDEARRNAAVLGTNFPASAWYHRAYALLENRGIAPVGGETTHWYSGITALPGRVVNGVVAVPGAVVKGVRGIF